MDQEQIYLEMLELGNRFNLVNGVLAIYFDSGNMLTFEAYDAIIVRTRSPYGKQLNQEPPVITSEPVDPTPIPDFDPPAGFKEYQDTVAGVSIYIPESWTVTGVMDGEYAIFQSYPEDKYVGGEGHDPGDTKCDLNIRPEGSRAEEMIQQWKADPMTTIVYEDEFILQSGVRGQKFIIDNMGRATVFVTELNQRAVLLTCFGDSALVDEIASTLKDS